mmetsp:Transcript_12312/g.31833  ORF Transcript_12312/g.31833 Transcript_12312/m.31833 type:complete len:206 (-) Transcript_12312:602-1219(-)
MPAASPKAARAGPPRRAKRNSATSRAPGRSRPLASARSWQPRSPASGRQPAPEASASPSARHSRCRPSSRSRPRGHRRRPAPAAACRSTGARRPCPWALAQGPGHCPSASSGPWESGPAPEKQDRPSNQHLPATMSLHAGAILGRLQVSATGHRSAGAQTACCHPRRPQRHLAPGAASFQTGLSPAAAASKSGPAAEATPMNRRI